MLALRRRLPGLAARTTPATEQFLVQYWRFWRLDAGSGVSQDTHFIATAATYPCGQAG
jgi:hypothetical protein